MHNWRTGPGGCHTQTVLPLLCVAALVPAAARSTASARGA
ncbi:hypothetical protein SFUMM280S_02902 [Streptomyces fumanus]